MDALLAPGSLVSLQNKQRFALVRQLGRGAEGVVFLAHSVAECEGDASPLPVEQVALKFIAAGGADKCESTPCSDELAALALAGGMGER